MPFPFYNTAPPTPSTKNNITDIAVTYGIRDFLLNKNLLPTYPFITTAINGSPRIGEPVLDTSINGDANVIPFGLPLETEGIFRYNLATAPNQFKNSDPTSPSLVSVDDITQTQGVFGTVDFPIGIQSYPNSATQQVAEYGLLGKTAYAGFRKSATLYNLYLDTTKQVDAGDWISLQPAGFTQQLTGYLDQYGGLNLGDSQSGIQAANIIGSILNGQGLGFTKGGVVPNFDIRSSLAGRVLGAAGAMSDTKLGMIGGQQLALALANNAAFNLQQDILGTLNVQDNVLALVKGGPLPGLRPNYQITVPSSTLGKVADYTEKVLGFTIPRSYLTDAGSIFSSENQSGNIQRANSMILNTGKGQNEALIANVIANINGTGSYDAPFSTTFRSGYVPGYTNNKGELAVNPTLYAFYDDVTKGTILSLLEHSKDSSDLVPKISYDRSDMIKKYGFEAPSDKFFVGHRSNPGYDERKISDIGFSWGSPVSDAINVDKDGNYEELVGDKKSLLVKTQKLFNSKGMLNIVTVKGDMGNSSDGGKHSSQIETANAFGISKGSAVIKGDRYTENGYFKGDHDTAENTYCRSWTTLDRYDQVSKMIRSSGLNKTVPYRFETTNSTLDDYGFPKIAPYITDKNFDGVNVADPKKFMFSIENLAWADTWQNLPPVEVGMGDKLSGKKGRIMWFPPYNIQFSESSNVNWESTNFIGRGEPVYTYNNTERTGNLSFSIIVDHPSYINSFRGSQGPDDNYVASFFAGCIDPNAKFADKLTVSEKSSIQESQIIIEQKATITKEQEPSATFAVYFPNDTVKLDKIFSGGYENGLQNGSATPTAKIDITVNPMGQGFGIGDYVGGVTSNSPWPDRFNYGLNGWENKIKVGDDEFEGFTDSNYITKLAEYLDQKCPHCVVSIKSYASPHGTAQANKTLADGRTQTLYDYFKKNLWNGKDDAYKTARLKKLANKAITYSETSCRAPKDGGQPDDQSCKKDRRTEVSFQFDSNLAQKDLVQPKPIVKNQQQQVDSKIVNRLYNEGAYFEQLTDADKFVFDSFRQKIRYFHPAFHSTTPEGLNSRLTFLQQCTRQGPTLESMDANNLAFGRPPICILRVGDFYNTKIVIDNVSIDYEPLVWDLNPEGVGVQPMIANVTLSFKFIGASSLMGPINKLQNALSFNYYANTHVYDPRADYIAKRPPETPKPANTSPSDLPMQAVTQEGIDKLGPVNVTALRDWYLVNGETNLMNNPTYSYTETTTTDINSTVDQTKDADNATNANTPQQNGPPPPTTPNAASGDDLDRIKLYRVDNQVGGVELFFEIQGNAALNNEQEFRATITDNTIEIEIGVGKLNTTDLVQTFIFTGFTSQLVDEKTYFVKAKFGSTSKTQLFTYIND